MLDEAESTIAADDDPAALECIQEADVMAPEEPEAVRNHTASHFGDVFERQLIAAASTWI